MAVLRTGFCAHGMNGFLSRVVVVCSYSGRVVSTQLQVLYSSAYSYSKHQSLAELLIRRIEANLQWPWQRQAIQHCSLAAVWQCVFDELELYNFSEPRCWEKQCWPVLMSFCCVSSMCDYWTVACEGENVLSVLNVASCTKIYIDATVAIPIDSLCAADPFLTITV